MWYQAFQSRSLDSDSTLEALTCLQGPSQSQREAAQGFAGTFKPTTVHTGHCGPPWQVTALFSATQVPMSNLHLGNFHSSQLACTAQRVESMAAYRIKVWKVWIIHQKRETKRKQLTGSTALEIYVWKYKRASPALSSLSGQILMLFRSAHLPTYTAGLN